MHQNKTQVGIFVFKHPVYAQNAVRYKYSNLGNTYFQEIIELIETIMYLNSKGQLISKCPFGVNKSTKKTNKNFVRISALASKKRSNQKSSVRESN